MKDPPSANRLLLQGELTLESKVSIDHRDIPAVDNDGTGPSSITLIHLPEKETHHFHDCVKSCEVKGVGVCMWRGGWGGGGSAMDLLLQPHQSVIIFVTMQLDPDY